MDLPILTSKKGTRVIKSTQLHRALGLNDSHYQTNVKHWLSDVYQFHDAIRKPAAMAEFARTKGSADGLVREYYFCLEFARLIALASRSKVKQAVANKLAREEEAFPQTVKLDMEAMLTLIEQTKAMTRVSCQLAAEQRHRAAYLRQRGSMGYFNHYRAELIGLRKEEILLQLMEQGVSVPKRSTLRDLLLRQDGIDLIRIGLIDLYVAQGHPLPYANEIGRIGKSLAKQMSLEVIDDSQGEHLFATPVDSATVAGIRGVAA